MTVDIYLLVTKVMEVKKFQDSRNAELDSFKQQYEFLKTQYATTLESALREPDSVQQQTLISNIQQINSQLTEELHGIINKLHKGSVGFDAKTMDELTDDLVRYQKQYEEIEKSKDKVTTLKRIQATTASNLGSATFMYYVYTTVLALLSFYVAYLAIKTAWPKSVFPTGMTIPQS